MGTPLGQPQALLLRLLQAALSILGYVEADKENGESVWVGPSVPAVLCPGDAPPQGSHWGRGWRNLGPTWCLLCPILYPEFTQTLPSGDFQVVERADRAGYRHSQPCGTEPRAGTVPGGEEEGRRGAR